MTKNKEVERDFVKELPHVEINIIDRPAFCLVQHDKGNGLCNFIFKYSNLREDTLNGKTENSNMSLKIGANSGCFYSLSFKIEYYKKSDLASLCRNFQTKYPKAPQRFYDNLNQFAKLARAILKEVCGKDGEESLCD